MLKVKISEVAPQFAAKLREHVVKSADSTPKERMEALGRDEKGRLKPLVSKPQDTQDQ